MPVTVMFKKLNSPVHAIMQRNSMVCIKIWKSFSNSSNLYTTHCQRKKLARKCYNYVSMTIIIGANIMVAIRISSDVHTHHND